MYRVGEAARSRSKPLPRAGRRRAPSAASTQALRTHKQAARFFGRTAVQMRSRAAHEVLCQRAVKVERRKPAYAPAMVGEPSASACGCSTGRTSSASSRPSTMTRTSPYGSSPSGFHTKETRCILPTMTCLRGASASGSHHDAAHRGGRSYRELRGTRSLARVVEAEWSARRFARRLVNSPRTPRIPARHSHHATPHTDDLGITAEIRRPMDLRAASNRGRRIERLTRLTHLHLQTNDGRSRTRTWDLFLIREAL